MMTNMELQKNKVLLGLSGGVDSATAALLLKEKGYEVTGYYFDVLGTNEQGKADAMALAEQLGIELITEDVSAEFKDIVIANFIDEYMHGRTPNPCIICNPNIKFKRLIAHANEIGAYYIATGHYARITQDDGKFYITRAYNQAKDQSYMLYRLGQEVLSRLIFPLGEFADKEETRSLARDNGLVNADKKDSQEICFIDPEEGYASYIERAGFASHPGDFVDKDGCVLGEHQGILNYTIGQRKGLGIALGRPVFVTKIDPVRNEVTLGENEDLFNSKVISKDNFFTAGKLDDYDGKTFVAKTRYTARQDEAVIRVIRMEESPAISKPASEAKSDGQNYLILAEFKNPQRAATPGQSIVFYDGERVIGGGFITESTHKTK